MSKDEYFDIEETIKHRETNNVNKRKIRHPLKPPAYVLLYGSLITALTNGTLTILDEYQNGKAKKEDKASSAITISEEIIDKPTLEVSRATLDNIYSYKFDVDNLFKELGPAIKTYYSMAPCITSKQKDEKEKAYNTIIYNNEKIIEVFNEVVKCHISRQLNVPTQNIDITFISADGSDNGTVTVSVNGKNALINEEFAELIKSYKKGLLITYNLNKNLLTDFLREEKVPAIMEIVENFRSVLKELDKHPEKYTVAMQKYDKVSEKELPNFEVSIASNTEENQIFDETQLPSKDDER